MIEEVSTDRAPRSALPVPQAVRAGDFVFISGQVAIAADGTVVVGDFEAEVRAVLDNVRAIVAAAGGGLADVCKVTAFLTSSTLFDRFNAVYAEYFTGPVPARSTVLALLMGGDFRIEVEAIAYLPIVGR